MAIDYTPANPDSDELLSRSTSSVVSNPNERQQEYFQAAATAFPAAQASLESLQGFIFQEESIPTCSTMEEVIEQVEKNVVNPEESCLDRNASWLITDLDYVLMTPEDPLGRPKGQIICQSLLKTKQISDDDRHKLAEKMITQIGYVSIQGAIKLLQTAQQKKMRCLGLTRMALKMNNGLRWRVEELKKLGIHFSQDGEDDKEIKWNEEGGYYKGVLRSGMNNKGYILEQYIASLEAPPRHIIFIDNNRWYIRSVRNVCRKLKIKFVGVHFVNKEFEADPSPLRLVIREQINLLMEDNKLVSYKEAFSRVEQRGELKDESQEVQTTLYEEWEKFSKHGRKESRSLILEKAQKGNHLAEAYAVCVLLHSADEYTVVKSDEESVGSIRSMKSYALPSSDSEPQATVKSAKQFMKKCYQFLKEKEEVNDVEAKYIIAHLMRRKLWYNWIIPTHSQLESRGEISLSMSIESSRYAKGTPTTSQVEGKDEVIHENSTLAKKHRPENADESPSSRLSTQVISPNGWEDYSCFNLKNYIKDNNSSTQELMSSNDSQD